MNVECSNHNEVDYLRSQVAALEQLLEVHEQTVCDQTATLEQTLAELRDNDERRQAIFNSARAGIMVIDAESHCIEEVNPCAVEMIGIPREQILGQVCHTYICPAQKGRCPITDLSRTMDNEERVLLRPGGRKIPIMKTVNTVVLKGRLHLVESFVDISDRKAAEQERERLNKQLVETSRRAGMADVASSVLHNVGNVLNSINVSGTLAADHLRKSRTPDLKRLVGCLQEHAQDLGAFVSQHPQGKHLLPFLTELSRQLMSERDTVLEELRTVTENVEHVKQIVAMQQSYATAGEVLVATSIPDLIEDALRIESPSLRRQNAEVVRDYADLPALEVDKHKILHVLVNLINNAKHAMPVGGARRPRLALRAWLPCEDRLRIEVRDNGIGIPAENLERVFAHGFTTRKDGHGYGLHSSALAAQQLGGSLMVQSEGPGMGAAFTLELPLKKVENAQCAKKELSGIGGSS